MEWSDERVQLLQRPSTSLSFSTSSQAPLLQYLTMALNTELRQKDAARHFLFFLVFLGLLVFHVFLHYC